MWRRWTCRRLSARLVDLAEGTLEANAFRRVVSHLAHCSECAATAAALRDFPRLLQDADGAPDEAFWRTQRHAVMRQVRTLAPPAPAPRRPAWSTVATDHRALRWAPAMAAAAAAGILLALHTLTPVAPDTPATAIGSLDDPALLSLSEVAGDSQPDVRQISDVAADDGPLPELSNEELHALAELVGVRER